MEECTREHFGVINLFMSRQGCIFLVSHPTPKKEIKFLPNRKENLKINYAKSVNGERKAKEVLSKYTRKRGRKLYQFEFFSPKLAITKREKNKILLKFSSPIVSQKSKAEKYLIQLEFSS